MLRRVFQRAYAVITQEGVPGVISRVKSLARRGSQQSRPDEFDMSLGVETSRTASLWKLRIPSQNVHHGSEYRTTHPSVFHGAVDAVPRNPGELSFLDLGCGKGRTLILAAQRGFKSVTGVEFSPELAATARQNLRLTGVTAQVIEIDASKFVFPDGDILVYMYNPFGKPVMQSVAMNLLEWRKRNTAPAYVVYLNPVCESIFDSLPAFQPVAKRNAVRVWKLH